ncbi:unnamed protein product [Heligmosomoides polygyrus]|uniref:Cell cycle checkpoint control protein RAD9A n=1 Tax=Heligmosomoides polygyrus TaxID=6339 RepID=A0A3P7YDG0_HELPZ|nr:unnamed protein product [Heligmosomoides polygyrus]
MSLRAFNKCRSAYGVFLLADDFFSDFDTKCLASEASKDCRLSMRTALSIFKSAYFVEKNLVSCTLTVDYLGRELHIDFQQTCDVTRSFDVAVMEKHKPFTSDVKKSDLRNAVTVNASEIAAFLNEMHSGYEELMMSAQADKFVFKNFLQLAVGDLNASLFQAILTFARQHACDVNLYFDKPGRPLIVAVESDAGYSAEFVIATMDGDEESDEDSPGMTQEPSRLQDTQAEPNERGQSQQAEEMRRDTTALSQDGIRDDTRPPSRLLTNEAIEGLQALIDGEFMSNSVMEVDVHRDEEALDNHMRMDDLVLGGENRAGASVEPVREHVVSQERPAASGRKFVNVAFQRRFLGINTVPRHQSQVAADGNPIVEPTQLPPSR